VLAIMKQYVALKRLPTKSLRAQIKVTLAPVALLNFERAAITEDYREVGRLSSIKRSTSILAMRLPMRMRSDPAA